MAPLQRGAALFPAAALRSDPGLLLTAARFFGPELLSLGLVANQLTVCCGAAALVIETISDCQFPRNVSSSNVRCYATVLAAQSAAIHRRPAQGPFSSLVDRHVTDRWLKWVAAAVNTL